MTASRSPPPTSSALGTCCRARRKEKLRVNPRKAWYRNLDEVTTNGDYEATFHLKRPQPALLALLASGYSPVYPVPCAAGADAAAPDRHRAVQIRRVQAERVHQGRHATRITGRRAGPISTAIEYTIMPNRSTAILGFVAGKFDMTWPYSVTVPLMKDVKSQAPKAICELRTEQRHRQPAGQPREAAVRQRRTAPGAGAGARPQGLHRHHDRGPGQDRRARCCRRPRGCGACRTEMLRTLPGYDPDVAEEPRRGARDHEEARLRARQAARRSRSRRATSRSFRDPAVILIDQLKQIYIDAVLETIETANWFRRSRARTTRSA